MKNFILLSFITVYTVLYICSIGCKKKSDAIYDFSVSDSIYGKPFTFIPDKTIAGSRSFYWDFGDHTYSTEPKPVHTYSASNVYNARLIVNNDTAHRITKYVFVYLTSEYTKMIHGTYLFHHYNTYPSPWPPYSTTTYKGDENYTIQYLNDRTIKFDGHSEFLKGVNDSMIYFSDYGYYTNLHELSFNYHSGEIIYTINFHVSAAAGDGADNFYYP